MAFDHKKKKTDYVYAGIIRRALARVIDAIIVGIIFYIYYLFMQDKIETIQAAIKAGKATIPDLKQLGAILTGCILIHIFYHVVIPSTSLCATFGKRIMGCIILNKYAQKPGLFRLYFRYLTYEWIYTVTVVTGALIVYSPSILSHLPIKELQQALIFLSKKEPISYATSFVVVFFMPLFIPLNRKKMGLHDMIVGTRVVRA